MGLKEKRKKIEREIADMVNSGPKEKVFRELVRLAAVLEEQLKLCIEAETAEANIP